MITRTLDDTLAEANRIDRSLRHAARTGDSDRVVVQNADIGSHL